MWSKRMRISCIEFTALVYNESISDFSDSLLSQKQKQNTWLALNAHTFWCCEVIKYTSTIAMLTKESTNNETQHKMANTSGNVKYQMWSDSALDCSCNHTMRSFKFSFKFINTVMEWIWEWGRVSAFCECVFFFSFACQNCLSILCLSSSITNNEDY